jgi:hypothetical protein
MVTSRMAGMLGGYRNPAQLHREKAKLPVKNGQKVAPFLGPLFKEAERREVREDFARCRSDKQTGHSGVVENYELW